MANHLLSKYYEVWSYSDVAKRMKIEALKFAETKWSSEEDAYRQSDLKELISSGFAKLYE